jgi:predicted NBD/HSP70 family sugar kinase
LGRTVVSAVNLLSPNAVLFSGGMSNEEDFLFPLIEYIKTHSYSAGALPELGKAALGELAPMIGAALCDLSQ